MVEQFRLTEPARRALYLAHVEAARFHRAESGTEHLLAGLLQQGDGRAAIALRSFGITLDGIRRCIGDRFGSGQEKPAEAAQYTPDVDEALRYAQRERLFDRYATYPIGVDTEHVLIGVIYNLQFHAVDVLADLGVSAVDVVERVREVIADRSGSDPEVSQEALVGCAGLVRIDRRYRTDTGAVIGVTAATEFGVRVAEIVVTVVNRDGEYQVIRVPFDASFAERLAILEAQASERHNTMTWLRRKLGGK